MTENIYTETLTPEELSGEHIGLMARAQSTRGMSTYTSEGPITDIAFSTEGAMVMGTDSKIRVNGATVKIGKEWWALEFVRFHYDAAGIRTRRGPDNPHLPEDYVTRVGDWPPKHAQAGEEAENVTIPRGMYDILVSAYKAFEAAERASWARSTVPMLTPSELEALDQA